MRLLAGWEVVQRVLKNEYYLKHSGKMRQETVVRPVTAGSAESGESLGQGGLEAEVEAESREREVKDKERWARLRRVKSLFDTKGGKKLQRTTSGKSKAT